MTIHHVEEQVDLTQGISMARVSPALVALLALGAACDLGTVFGASLGELLVHDGH